MSIVTLWLSLWVRVICFAACLCIRLVLFFRRAVGTEKGQEKGKAKQRADSNRDSTSPSTGGLVTSKGHPSGLTVTLRQEAERSVSWFLYRWTVEAPLRWSGSLIYPGKFVFWLPTVRVPLPSQQSAYAGPTEPSSLRQGSGSDEGFSRLSSYSASTGDLGERCTPSVPSPKKGYSQRPNSTGSSGSLDEHHEDSTPPPGMRGHGARVDKALFALQDTNRRIVLGGHATLVVLMMPWEKVPATVDFAVRYASCIQCDACVLSVDEELLHRESFKKVVEHLTSRLVAILEADAECDRDKGQGTSGGDSETPRRCILWGSSFSAMLAVAMAQSPSVSALILQDPVVSEPVPLPLPRCQESGHTPASLPTTGVPNHSVASSSVATASTRTPLSSSSTTAATGDSSFPPGPVTGKRTTASVSPLVKRKEGFLQSLQRCVGNELTPLRDWLDFNVHPRVPVCVLVDGFNPWVQEVQNWTAFSSTETRLVKYNSNEPLGALAEIQSCCLRLLHSSRLDGAHQDPLTFQVDPYCPNFPSLAEFRSHGGPSGQICRYYSVESLNVSNISGDDLNPDADAGHSLQSYASSGFTPRKVQSDYGSAIGSPFSTPQPSPSKYGYGGVSPGAGGKSIAAAGGLLAQIPTIHSVSSFDTSEGKSLPQE
jgi:hypothetical protein